MYNTVMALISPDIVGIHPHRSHIKTKSLNSNSLIIIIDFFITLIKDHCFEKPWNIEDDAENYDGRNVFENPEIGCL